jgi:hypothetical protein
LLSTIPRREMMRVFAVAVGLACAFAPELALADAGTKVARESKVCVGKNLRVTSWASPDAGTLVVVEGMHRDGRFGTIAVDPASVTEGTGDFIATFTTTISALTDPKQPNMDANANAGPVCARYKGGPLAEDIHGKMAYTPDTACVIVTCVPIIWDDDTRLGRHARFAEPNPAVCNTPQMTKLLCPPPPPKDKDGDN